MLSIDNKATLSDLDEYLATVERKLKRMVEGFAYEIAFKAGSNTPIGDPENGNSRYMALYQRRFDKLGIPIEGGYHRGAWQYSENGSFVFNPSNVGDSSHIDAATWVEDKARASYKIGETFYIGVNDRTGGFAALENNSSAQTNGQGIMKPTLDTIMNSYQVDLKAYFDKG